MTQSGFDDRATMHPTPHVFVTRGDLTHVACDAWMVSTDRTLNVLPHWTKGNDALQRAIAEFDDRRFRYGKVHASAPPSWTARTPVPIFTAVPIFGFTETAEFVDIIDDFARVAVEALATLEVTTKRPLPLLAMPIIGSGGGGGAGVIGDLIRTVIEAAELAAHRRGVDIVIVVRDASQIGLAQRIRRGDRQDRWSELSPAVRVAAEDLAHDCLAGNVVPFLGAGISMSAGAPSWDSLVTELSSAVTGQLTEAEKTSLAKKNVLDQAEILKNLYDSPESFNAAVAKLVNRQSYGLAPTLIANLPLEQAITLNYDELFEIASNDAGQPCAVIPGDEAPDAHRWLLKMHGNVADESTIVLTRTDYVGFDANRNVLAALVKASLVTKRLVFIGFGLGDDHFHQILHDVRQMSPESIARRALALTLSDDSLERKAWKNKITLQPMTPEGTGVAMAGRVLEIFLDYLLMLSTDSREYLLDPAYASQLTPSEHRLKDIISQLHALRDDADDPSIDAAVEAIRGFGQSG
ncbi:SIR2 family protein [Brevibacterium casei]|uniref:SIR2 family protein n=1 Tax=Brevibacterium casei TaxID=33889 RepID=UPI00223ADBF1|nr:SIR2 family protein [Brevibacterium casei]MCT1447319.1 SIR2 family protein [Brevibacterium casei]